jgi:APA family basic amino acid/polyamine antiporter
MSQDSLLRTLGLNEASAIVIGSVIGTGVFLKTATMAQEVGSPFWVLAAWATAGALSLMGALTYAEVGALFPQTGGEYVFLREGYGRLAGFLYGWTRFWIVTPGSVAAYAVGTATFAEGFLPPGHRALAAVGIIAFFSALNCFSVAFGGRVQTVMTALKILLIMALAGALLVKAHPAPELLAPGGAFRGWSAFGAAVLAALWAFDGWNNLPMAAGEVKEPGRNVPIALIGGTLIVLVIYGLANLSYFSVLPFSDILTSSSTAYPAALPVATRAAGVAYGATAVTLLSVLFAFSAVGAMNGSILTGARIPFSMARDGLFFRKLGEVSHTTRVPAVSVLVQGVLAAVMASLGTFDQLTDYVIFASWVFYALVTAALFIFRRRWPEKERPYRTPFYPWLPAVFLMLALALLMNTIWTSPRESAIGFVLIAAGVPVYFVFRRQKIACK